jgi:hypothetical protein
MPVIPVIPVNPVDPVGPVAPCSRIVACKTGPFIRLIGVAGLFPSTGAF